MKNKVHSNNKRFAPWGIAVLLLAVFIAGCGTKANNAGNASPSASAPASSSPAASSEERVIKHAMGEAKVPANPKNIVVLTNEGTEALLALGIKPIGAVKSYVGDPWYPHIKDQMADVQELGKEGEPNLELIAGLKPDLIIGNKLRHEKIYEQLNAIAPTVISETLRGDWKDNFALYADTVGKKEDGDKLLAEFDAKIESFKAKAGDKLKETVSVVRFMGGKTRVYHTDTFTGIIFNQIGLPRNEMTLKAKDQFVDEITEERLPEADADRLFYFTYETGDGKATDTEKEWTNDALWKSLNVVKNGKVHRVDDSIWNTAGGIIAANLMMDQLAEIYELK